jgi:hypothetical protein
MFENLLMFMRGDMHMKTKILIALGVAVILAIAVVTIGSAVSGAAFTTFNAHVDGAGKDVCKNSAIDCNIYGAKEYVWLNGGPTANGLGPDGQYFFAVLVPGGQPNPNDGAVGSLNDGDKNLSDDYDAYTNRTFTVTDGEVSAYSGTHWLDDGKSGPKPNWKPPYIRLFPYADTTNPGGVYIMAICSLDKGYPVDPRDCKYDAFKVKKGKLPYGFMLSGIKFQDTYADGVKGTSAEDPGLPGWSICITGTGPDGNPINNNCQTTTGAGGYWEWFSPDYMFSGGSQPGPVHLTICEVLKPDWNQSYPASTCYTLDFTPVAGSFDSFENLDFGNWQTVDVTACKVRDLDGKAGGEIVPVPGWMVSLTKEGVVQDTKPTGSNGCYTWMGLTPGFKYDVHEESKAGWEALGDTDFVFPKAKSGESFSYTFVNAVLQGCTPGFWQGGNDFGTAGGQWLWNEVQDPQWAASGGANWNPYIWTTPFSPFFTAYSPYLDGFDMMTLVGNGGGPNDYQKAARDLVAAYLNTSWGMNYPYSQGDLKTMWATAVSSGDFMSLHLLLDAANNSGADTNGDGILEHQCPISASGY